MSKIYIVRHGETIWNLEQRFQGWENSDLTKKGQKQAMLAGQFLRDKNVQQIYCSPLQRCLDTLQIIKDQVKPLNSVEAVLDSNLKECHYGKIEGENENLIRTSLLLQGIDRKDPGVKFNFKFKNGESYKDQLIRVLRFVSTNDLQNTDLNTLIVCHMGTMKYLSIALQNKVETQDIYGATMWRPGNDTVIVFDTISKSVEIIKI
jgi:broad specificity phosphatase PhoE